MKMIITLYVASAALFCAAMFIEMGLSTALVIAGCFTFAACYLLTILKGFKL